MKSTIIALLIKTILMGACIQIGEAIKAAEMPELTYTTEATIDRDTFIMMAQCVEAEAGNQDLLGKRLVVDVILNRVDADVWPDDIEAVIAQKNQFAVYPSAMSKTVPSEETYQACWMELEHRTDTQIMYFAASGYISAPAYKHGGHYFSY